MIGSATQLDSVVKSIYTSGFKPLFQTLGFEYRLKEAYCRMMSPFIDTTTVTVDDVSAEFLTSATEYSILRLGDVGGERPVVADFLETVQPGDVLYDIGAFVGMYSILAAKKNVRTVAFEPNPTNRARLSKNVEINSVSPIETHPVALGDVTEKARLQTDTALDQRSRIVRETTGKTVQVVRGDDFLDDHDTPLPDVMKIDVEGAELAALRGFGEALSSCRVVFCEVHTDTSNVVEVEQLLQRRGFETETIHTRTGEIFIKAVKP